MSTLGHVTQAAAADQRMIAPRAAQLIVSASDFMASGRRRGHHICSRLVLEIMGSPRREFGVALREHLHFGTNCDILGTSTLRMSFHACCVLGGG